MSRLDHIPLAAIRRLSLYLRQLEILYASGQHTISSKHLGEALSISDAQVRKDLAYFGQFGRSGIGYPVPELIRRVRRILGTDRRSNVLLVGAGNLGMALISYRGFSRKGFEVVAVFDNHPEKIGRMVAGARPIVIQPPSMMAKMIRAYSIRLGIIAVPADAAQAVADELVAAGIRGLLNFAPVTLQVKKRIAFSSVDLAVHLEQLSFQLSSATSKRSI